MQDTELKTVRRLRGLVDDATFQLGRLTGENLTTYAKTFANMAKPEVNAGEIERDIKQVLDRAGTLPLDRQQLHAIRQMIVSAINRW